jgi:hypothetical protein
VAGNRDGSVTVLLNDGAGRFRRDRAYSSGAIARSAATRSQQSVEARTMA